MLAFATCHAYGALTPEDHGVVAELKARGVDVVPAVWDEPADWRCFDGVVLRSCWDYDRKQEAFRDWLAQLERDEVRVFNPPRVAMWNLDKHYLEELARDGATIPKTSWVGRGSSATLAETLAAGSFDAAVIKPAVGMLGIDTWRTSVRSAREDEVKFAEVVARRDLMVQEFVPDVLVEGELSLVFLGGRFSHAVRKVPREGEFRIHEEHGGTRHRYEPTLSQRRVAERILRSIDAPLLFARVDAIPVGDDLVVMEVELIDPSLFLGYDAQAASRFADAIVAAPALHCRR